MTSLRQASHHLFLLLGIVFALAGSAHAKTLMWLTDWYQIGNVDTITQVLSVKIPHYSDTGSSSGYYYSKTDLSLTKTNSGALIILTANDYNGVTAIAQGTVQLGNGIYSGTLGNSSIVDNGLLLMQQPAGSALGNTISGTGSFTQSGTGTTRSASAGTLRGSFVAHLGSISTATTRPARHRCSVSAPAPGPISMTVPPGWGSASSAIAWQTALFFAVRRIFGSRTLAWTSAGLLLALTSPWAGVQGSTKG